VQASRERALGTSDSLKLKLSLKKPVIRSNTLVSCADVGSGAKMSSMKASAEIPQSTRPDGDILFLSSIAKETIYLVGV